MFEKTLVLLMIFPLTIAALAVNITVHEGAHYAVAEFFGYQSELHFNNTVVKNYGFLLNGEPIAYTKFTGPNILPRREALIATAGPLANLIMALLALAAYVRKRNNSYISQLFFLAFFLTALVSFASNIIPYEFSDGKTILDALRTTI